MFQGYLGFTYKIGLFNLLVEGFDSVSQVLGFVGGPSAVGLEVEFGVWGLRIQVCGGRGERQIYHKIIYYPPASHTPSPRQGPKKVW